MFGHPRMQAEINAHAYWLVYLQRKGLQGVINICMWCDIHTFRAHARMCICHTCTYCTQIDLHVSTAKMKLRYHQWTRQAKWIKGEPVEAPGLWGWTGIHSCSLMHMYILINMCIPIWQKDSHVCNTCDRAHMHIVHVHEIVHVHIHEHVIVHYSERTCLLCVCMCMCIHTYIAYIHIPECVYIYTHIYMRIQSYQLHLSLRMQSRHANAANTYIRIHMHTCTVSFLIPDLHAYIHNTLIHTYMHTVFTLKDIR